MARFSKVFQLMTVVLLVAVVNVYVMGAPKVTEPSKGDTATTAESKADATGTEIAVNTKVALAADKLPLARGSKVDFNRLFSRTEITNRAATTHNFLNTKTAARDLFKAPPRTGVVPQNDDKSDSGGGGSKGTWIAVGVIAAVAVIAVIALRHDRSHPGGSSAQ
jgi:uncharacterized membrane protein